MSKVFTPAANIQIMFVALDRNTQLKIQHGLEPVCYWNNNIPHFRLHGDVYLFEARVEVAHLQKEMKEKWEKKYDDSLKDLVMPYIRRSMASFMSIPLCECVFFKCEHLTLEGVRAIHTIVCANEPTTKTTTKLRLHYIAKEEEKDEEEYKERVSTLLHKVASLASKNKSFTEELFYYSLKDFAAYLVKKRVEDVWLEVLERTADFVISCLDGKVKNSYSLLFEKYDKISPIQKEIISGLLNLDEPLEEKVSWISTVTSVVIKPDFKDGLRQKVLEEFLKKI